MTRPAAPRDPHHDADPEPSERRLSLEWELWVLENLLSGTRPGEVASALATQGLPREEAARQVAELARSPVFARMRVRAGRHAMAAQLLEIRKALHGPADVDARATLDRETFHREYWRPSRPVHITEDFAALAAVQRWTPASLARRFGDVEVEVNTRRDAAARRSETERVAERTTLGAYLEWIDRGAEGNDRYIVSRNGLLAHPALREPLGAELTPLPAYVEAPPLPRGASLWIGPRGTFSAAHFDPHSVLLVQIHGRKRVRLVPPDAGAFVEDMDGYFARQSPDDPALAARPDFDPGCVRTVELGPGEALFVPVAWFHEVTALSASITVSLLSFPWDNDFHWIRPLSAR